uniref:Rho-GAP domain-containing protein n=1 Tax=Trichobilharzia regenti TaxID=157069 RepID=A0AA85J3B7_TRIRE|nr:unnamed protein product [Trichobilharzia regenti]
MDLLNSDTDCVDVVRNYLSIHGTDVDASSDSCEVAFPATFIHDQTRYGIIISLVQNSSSNQSALFIFSRAKNYDEIELTDLVIVDKDSFCGEIDSRVHLPVCGKRIVDVVVQKTEKSANQQVKLYIVSNNVNNKHKNTSKEAKGNTSDIDSDVDGDDNDKSCAKNTVFLKSLNDVSGEKTIKKYRFHLSPVSFTLEFDQIKDALEFRKQLLNLSSMKLSELEDISTMYEVGQEALTTLNTSSSTSSCITTSTSEELFWLKKYWESVSQSSSSLLNTSSGRQLSSSNVTVNTTTTEVNGESMHHSSVVSKSTPYSATNVSIINKSIASPLSNMTDTKPSQVSEIEQLTNGYTSSTHSSDSKHSLSEKHSPSSSSSNLCHSKSSGTLHPLKSCHPLEELSTRLIDQQLMKAEEKDLMNSSLTNLDIDVSNKSSSGTVKLSHSCLDLTSNIYDSQSNKSKEYLEPRVFRARFNQAGNLIQKKLTERMNEYCKSEKISIYLGTWNVNGRSDNCMPLDDWLMPPDGQPPADIYVFGFQEMDLSLSVITLNKTSPTGPEEKWVQQLEEALGGLLKRPSPHALWAQKTGSVKSFAAQWFHHTGGGYLRVERVRLAGIIMIVYISARLSSHLHRDEISCQVVPTGVFNVMGNKGGVGIRLTVFNSSLCFVNCHLAAGELNLDRRNQDFREITRKMIFEFPMNPKSIIYPPERSYISDHDIVFVFGDLNYRIVGLDSSYVRKSIFGKDFTSLLKNDELLKQFESRKAFDGYREPPINFAPTYKFDMNSNVYDSSDKNRIPSYCDRILWSGKDCEPVVYRSHPVFVCSDHKPVSGYFSVNLRRIKRAAFQRTYESVLLSIDLTTNLSLPQAELDRQELDFGCVRFHELCSQTLTLTNIGLNDFQFKFLREGIGAFPSWLTVNPSCDWVKQGTSVKLEFQIFVNYKEVYALNSGLAKLSTIIVLQLEDGKDYFISISGQFIPTSFGLPLILLLTMGSDPVTKLSISELQEQIKLSRSENSDYFRTKLSTIANQKPFHVPKEIFRLVNHINEYITEPDLFRQMGPSSDITVIRDILDTTPASCPFPETISIHSIASCLLLFLNTLPESVIPPPYQEKCLNSLANFECAIQALQLLPVCNQNLFYYLITFMQRCLSYKEQNGTDIDLLAPCFGEIFFLESQVNNNNNCSSPGLVVTTNAQKNALAVKQLKRAAFISIFLRYNYLVSVSTLTTPH